ncbi:MAG TPA: hypothetical protein VI321_03575 [Burkholderiales bacterium]
MKPMLLTLTLALLGCAAGLALAGDAPRRAAQPLAKKVAFTKKVKASPVRPAAAPQAPAPATPAATPLYREDVTLEEMQRYHQ